MKSEIEQIESFLQDQIAPLANKIDTQPQVLKLALQKIGDRCWLALKVAPELGGTGLSDADYLSLQIAMARASGAFTFLQTQHQSAVAKLAQSPNKSLQQEFFPDVAKGKALIGVGFSHLRRRGVPMMQATQTPGGYLLTGKVPWITGYDFFSQFILGATLPDGKELYGIMPLQNQSPESGGEIKLSQPMELIAMAATNTVSAEINQWFLSSDRLVAISPAGSIHASSRRNILNHGFFALGCAYAGLDVLEAIAAKKQLGFLQESWQSLHQEVVQQENKVIASRLNNHYPQQLQLRAEMINLAQRCSLAAVIASGGASNYFNSSAGRIYREALLFSVSGQTADAMQASLNNLLRLG
ncbi:MAG: acyl-CoA dehydrogenase family protein [Pleurocapsa sp.]